MYRVEYGGHGSNCNVEGTLWFPDWFSAEAFEEWYHDEVEVVDVWDKQ